MAQRTPYTTEDKLLLTQVIYSYGAASWEDISYKLSEWSKERGKIVIMTPSECQYHYMMSLKAFGLAQQLSQPFQRLLLPYAPLNLELVRRLYIMRLQELHHEIYQKEEAFRIIVRDIADIRRGAWDGKIARAQRVLQDPTAPQTASSSSSQLTPIDSPAPPAAPAGIPVVQQPPEVELAESNEMQVETVAAAREEGGAVSTQSLEQLDVDAILASSPSLETPVERVEPRDTREGDVARSEEREGDESAGEKDTKDESDDAPPVRGLRSRKTAVEPIVPPTSATPQRGKGRKPSDTATHTSTRSKRRGATESSKAAHSPTGGSVAGTIETAPTPAATDENVSVAEEENSSVRRITRGHKRKASEMDVDLPAISKKTRDARERSSTAEEEPSTPAVASGPGRASSHRLRQSMTSIVTLLMNNHLSEIFRRPVTKKDAPDYARAVLRPIDLATIQRNIKAGKYGSLGELERDLRKMLANCFVYNKPGTDAHDTAKQMLEEVEQMLENAREAAQS